MAFTTPSAICASWATRCCARAQLLCAVNKWVLRRLVLPALVHSPGRVLEGRHIHERDLVCIEQVGQLDQLNLQDVREKSDVSLNS